VWQVEEVIAPALAIRDGAIAVPAGPGLGVELDKEALAYLHRQYLECGIRRRDDVSAMRVVDPTWTGSRPRF
jgi:glucarate dehydratase